MRLNLACSVILGSSIVCLACGDSPQAQSTFHPLLNFMQTNEPVQIIAHRGNSSEEPENTLAAFKSAIEAQADLVELDYHHSADNVPIVIHDDSLGRTTDIGEHTTGSIFAVKFYHSDFLSTLDAGTWYSASRTGERLPFLSEALDLIQGAAAKTLIERKHGDAATCYYLLKSKGIIDEVVVQAFDWTYLKKFRKFSASIALAALGKGPLLEAKLKELLVHNIRILNWQYSSLNEKAIRLAHRYGFKVWAYVVDNSQDAKKLVAMGVDGVITNYPRQLREALNLPLPQ